MNQKADFLALEEMGRRLLADLIAVLEPLEKNFGEEINQFRHLQNGAFVGQMETIQTLFAQLEMSVRQLQLEAELVHVDVGHQGRVAGPAARHREDQVEALD